MQKTRWISLGIVLGIIVSAAFGFSRQKEEARDNSQTVVAAKNPATVTASASVSVASKDDGKLRIIAFGAHPDDCEIRCGGTAAMWAEAGHHVKLVSTTNGDIGHSQMAGGPLAIRRNNEVQAASKILGVTTEVLDIHDGELMPTLENRRTLTRKIRQWNADIVLSHRPNDYHPDHRYTGVLVQDAAFMVAVPFFCPDTPHLRRNPVFLYYWDGFQRPNPFRPDIAVAIDDVIEKRVEALAIMESQFLEGGALGYNRDIPQSPEARKEGLKRVRENFRRRYSRNADAYRAKLIELYGEERGKQVKYAEAFEVCEYGRRPSHADLLKLFPFVPQQK